MIFTAKFNSTLYYISIVFNAFYQHIGEEFFFIKATSFPLILDNRKMANYTVLTNVNLFFN